MSVAHSNDGNNQQPEPVFVSFLRSPGIDFQPGGKDSLESIFRLFKSLQIRARGSLNVYKIGLWSSFLLIYSSTGYCRVRSCKHLWSPGIDYQPSGPVQQSYLTYRPARLHRLAESIPGLLKRLQIRALFFPQFEWNSKTTYKDGSASAFYTSFVFR